MTGCSPRWGGGCRTGRVLKLVRLWLEAGVMVDGEP